MKISFFRYSLLNRGGDKMILAHAAHLAISRHEVRITTNRINTLFFINPEIKIVPMAFGGKLGTLFSALYKKQNVDILVADIISLACFLYIRNRQQVVYFAQDYDESYYTNYFQKLFIRFLYFVGLSLFKIPTIAVSEKLAHVLEDRFKVNVKVVANEVDTSVFYPDPSEVLISQKERRKSILILSRSDRRKGFDSALEVVKHLSLSCSVPFEIWTVGESAKGKFDECVHRDFGYVPETELRVLMSSADIFLYPSRHEGYGLMAAEAFACKCPVITSDAVAFAKHEHNAMVSKVDDVKSMSDNIIRIFKDYELRQKLIQEGYSLAKRSSQQSTSARFESVLAEISHRVQSFR